MQKNLLSFFKPSSKEKSVSVNTSPSLDNFDCYDVWELKQPQVCIKYNRKAPTDDLSSKDTKNELSDEEVDEARLIDEELKTKSSSLKLFNKKRSYAQFHLDLGQSDFMLHTCSICGIKYAKGDVVDEKVHSEFHKNYTHGIQFMGWLNERVIELPSLKEGRVILVLDNDPPAQKKKVQEMVRIMETELGDGWVFHDLCKVYFFVSSRRVVGCLISESICKAYRVVTDSADHLSDFTRKNESASKSSVLPFGGVNFVREVNKRASYLKKTSGKISSSSIVCEEESLPACCGVRAIWVSPSNRRKQIATHLLDAMRQSFCHGPTLACSQVAFSQPTSAGIALASKYSGTNSFLVYKTS